MIPLTGHQGCLILCGVAAIAAGVLGWQVNGWRLESRYTALQAKTEKSYADALAEAKTKQQAAASTVVELSDKLHAAEVANEQRENARDAAIAAGDQRVHVRAKCPDNVPADAAAAGSIDGAGPELDPAYRQTLSDLRRAAKSSAEQIDALKTYANQCHLLTMQAH